MGQLQFIGLPNTSPGGIPAARAGGERTDRPGGRPVALRPPCAGRTALDGWYSRGVEACVSRAEQRVVGESPKPGRFAGRRPRQVAWRRCAVCLLTSLAVAGWQVSAVTAAEPPRDTEAIGHWIEQLGATQFARREAASRSLVAAGPAALAPLMEAIGEADLEVASRSVEIVRDLLDSTDPETALEAELALEQVAEQGADPLARVAAAALDFHFLGSATEARLELESLGAEIGHEPGLAGGGCEVHLGADWHGDTAALRHLTRLRGVVRVSLHGVPVSTEAVGVLGRLRGIRRLDLYNTGIDAAGVRLLTEKLPDAVLDVRKGGRLGVSAGGLGGPCEIAAVQPGSAAARAGLRGGDVVVAIEGVPIQGFEALTDIVARRGPGESITLTIERLDADAAGRRLDCVVTLDAW